MDNQVLVELRSNYTEFMQRILKFHRAINEAFAEKLNSALFIEPLMDSLLYIFQDFDTFKKIHKPLPKVASFFAKYLLKIPEEDESAILGDSLKSDKKFPDGGIEYYLSSKTTEVSILFPYLRDFYVSVHPKITVTLQQDFVRINFNSFEAVRRNFELTYSLVKRVLTQHGISINDLFSTP